MANTTRKKSKTRFYYRIGGAHGVLVVGAIDLGFTLFLTGLLAGKGLGTLIVAFIIATCFATPLFFMLLSKLGVSVWIFGRRRVKRR